MTNIDRQTLSMYLERNPQLTVDEYTKELKQFGLWERALELTAKARSERLQPRRDALVAALEKGDFVEVSNILIR